MSERVVRLITVGRYSQLLRLPRAFHMPGDRVRMRREGDAVIVEPFYRDIDEWFAEIDRHGPYPFAEGWREQPPMPEEDDKR